MFITSVGYFKEMLDGSPSDPSIKDYIHKGTSDINEKNMCLFGQWYSTRCIAGDCLGYH